MAEKKKKLFCELNPACYAISKQKEIIRRHIKNTVKPIKLTKTFSKTDLPNLVAAFSNNLIKRGPGVDPAHQYNKAENIALAASKINGIIIRPDEEFSFWGLVGKVSKKAGYKEGRIIKENRLTAGIGGGLCNLANTIHRLILHSPLTVTEFHKHSDALAPDEGPRIPFSAGTSISYNYIDYRFKNTTDQCFQLKVWCADEKLYGELRSEEKIPFSYKLIEEDHHFKKEGEKYYRNSKIYREITSEQSGETKKELVFKNHSEVMYDYALIPKELIEV